MAEPESLSGTTETLSPSEVEQNATRLFGEFQEVLLKLPEFKEAIYKPFFASEDELDNRRRGRGSCASFRKGGMIYDVDWQGNSLEIDRRLEQFERVFEWTEEGRDLYGEEVYIYVPSSDPRRRNLAGFSFSSADAPTSEFKVEHCTENTRFGLERIEKVLTDLKG